MNHISGLKVFNIWKTIVLLGAITVSHCLNGNDCLADIGEKTNAEEDKSTSENITELLENGNALLKSGKFSEALPVWLKVLKSSPDNPNYSFKLGLCYRNSFDKQTKSLPYFKVATSDMTAKYDFYGNSGKEAPFDAIYFLAEAYMYANNPVAAVDFFNLYLDRYNGTPPIDVSHQVRYCLNAQKMINSPLQIKFTNIGNMINTVYTEANPVISIDKTKMLFSSRRLRDDRSNKGQFDKNKGVYSEDIYIADNVKGEWKNAKIFKHNTDQNEAPLAISADGKTVYLNREDKGVYNLYYSTFIDGEWEEPKKLGSNINSAYDESGLSISANGKHLYFTSARAGGQGGTDIYHCELVEGKWGKAKNIGAIANSPYSEVSPYIHPNGKRLYFSSNGFQNISMGGYDIFYTELQDDGSWSIPINVGYPINSTRDDINFFVTPDGDRYVASINKENNYDIFLLKKGRYDASNLKPGTVVEVQTETEVMEILELERIVEQEVEVLEIVEVETEVEKFIEIETEVEVIEIIEVEVDPQIAIAKAEKAKADAQKAEADAQKAKAEAEIKLAEAQKARAQEEIVKAEAEKAKAEAEIMEAKAKVAKAEIKKA
ncbi:PD40 domain-containing protein, partial [bacterium AH-315-C07]|nr:PD40 domain-containing protein [bacterium AH-315-C07]